MKRLNPVFYTLLLFLLPAIPGYAFFDKDIHLLTMQNGLADNTVNCIYKDRDGFIWFGGNNGLSRYDGNAIRNFGKGKEYMSVSEITEISDGCMAVIADNSLLCFNRKMETFVPIAIAADSSALRATRLLPAEDNCLWVLSGNKLARYRQTEVRNKQGEVTSVSLQPEKEYTRLLGEGERFSVFCYSPDKKILCLMSDQGNLILFRPEAPKAFRKIKLSDARNFDTIKGILYSGGFIWVSTLKQGIIRYQPSSGRTDCINYGGKGKEGLLSHTDVYQLISIGDQRYLAVTWNGYTILTQNREQPEELTSEIYNNTFSQLYHNLDTRMLSAYYDPNGVLWIGTNGGGVMYSDLRLQFSSQYHQERHNEICGILTDKERHLWLASFHKGIMRSDEPFDPAKRLTFSAAGTEEVKARTTVLCTLKEEGKGLWFGNADGTLTFYDERSGQFTVYPLWADGRRQPAGVWSLFIDRRKRFLIGTKTGLYLFDPASAQCRTLNREVYVKAIVETKDGTIWLGTNNKGVCRMIENDRGEVRIENGYESKSQINARAVRALLASSDGNLYIGYTTGFAILSPASNAIRNFYTTHDGLCSNFIGSLAEDGKGRIWLGSNSGISRYSRHQHLFYNYYISGNNRTAFFCDKTLFFGNNRSLTYFNPEKTNINPDNDRVFITGLEVNNHPVNIGEKINGQVVLDKGLLYANSIVLDNANRDFSLSFNNLSYSEEQQKYNYRLLPYQKNWLVSYNGEKASYTNLPEGEYTFEVKSIYPDGHNGKTNTLKIKILPHWSRTLAFRLLVFMLCAAGVFYLIRRTRLRQRRMEQDLQMKHELLTVRLEREKERQIHVERENFFTGAAHELRTPLTLILAPLQELIRLCDPSAPQYRQLLTMYKNGTSLHTLVDQLLYVQKIDAGMVKLHLSQVDIKSLANDVAESFRQMAESKEYRFEVSLPPEKLLLWIDRDKITAAIRNLLSNSFKYTAPGGSVLLTVSRTMKDGKEFCKIAVSDTGTGISKELQEHVFESFITGDNIPEFSTKAGIGLRIVKNTMDLHHGQVTLDSTPGEGSTFVLLIPEGKAHFANDAYEMADYPLQQIPNMEQVPVQLSPDEPESGNKAIRKSILVIEDNEDVREYICSLFACNYTVLKAVNGEEGVRVATERLPSLIISDVMMPVKDGFACCREIREQQKTAHIPIIMLTAKAEEADFLQGSRCGVDDYMMKPFNPEVLKAKAENLILQRERLKRIYSKALLLKDEPADGEAKDAFMEQMIAVIEANLANENFNVKILAEQMNMSQPTLYRKVKQHSPLTVIDIIRGIRVSKAASLIMENRYSIQEISEMVGFSDARTLRKHFTEQFGVSPSKYSV